MGHFAPIRNRESQAHDLAQGEECEDVQPDPGCAKFAQTHEHTIEIRIKQNVLSQSNESGIV
jgi:hypothetical protein